jgi:antitoxin (DNA-binding transcriptional repressor) of toxin-antitoxin stability system
MTIPNVSEGFLTITELRNELGELSDRFRRRSAKAAENSLCVEVVTDHGKPVATVMPYEAYTRIRELLMLARAQADLAAGRVLSFKAGTSPEEAFDEVLNRKAGGPRRTRKAG